MFQKLSKSHALLGLHIFSMKAVKLLIQKFHPISFYAFLCTYMYMQITFIYTLWPITSAPLFACFFFSTAKLIWTRLKERFPMTRRPCIFNLIPKYRPLSWFYKYHLFHRFRLSGMIPSLLYFCLPDYFSLVEMLPYCLFPFIAVVTQKVISAVQSIFYL